MPLTIAESPVAQILKAQTAERHRITEEILLPHLESAVTTEAYANILKTFYGFHYPVEQSVAAVLPSSVLPDVDLRLKSQAILQDLAAIGHGEDDIPLCTALPQAGTAGRALGILYVLEGSTLGGKSITQLLLRNGIPGLENGGLRFFNVYGENTGRMWKGFLQVAEEHREDIDDMLHAANETFFLFQQWIEQTLPHEQPSGR
jgi:heme oxygenase